MKRRLAKAEKKSKKGQDPEDSDTTSDDHTSGSGSADGGDAKDKDKDLECKSIDGSLEDLNKIFDAVCNPEDEKARSDAAP